MEILSGLRDPQDGAANIRPECSGAVDGGWSAKCSESSGITHGCYCAKTGYSRTKSVRITASPCLRAGKPQSSNS